MNKSTYDPFSKYIPSVFVICSPFQALCAIAAIRNLEISDYKIILMLGNQQRDYQLLRLLEFYSVEYEKLVLSNFFRRLKYYLPPLISKKSDYKRLFVGDFRQHLFVRVGMCYVSNYSSIVYLDDGVASLPLLNGLTHLTTKMRLFQKLNYAYMALHHINREFNLYTIYDGITNSNYNIRINNFESVFNCISEQSENQRGIYVIGTVLEAYCAGAMITKEQVLSELKVVLNELTINNKDEIKYVAHGRDNGELTRPLCEELNIDFIRPDMTIEMYLLVNRLLPRLIVGFNSTALYNLKKMLPTSTVRNILFLPKKRNNLCIEREYIAEYFERNNIETEERIVAV